MDKNINLKSRLMDDLNPISLLFLVAELLTTVSFTGAVSQESNNSHEEFASGSLG